jgi:hypothetical protein
MALAEKRRLMAAIAPPLDHFLCSQLIDEFISAERRFIQRDWEPAELDGGQFCEILARLLYHQDSAVLSRNKNFEDCCKYLENDQVVHAVQPRQVSLHFVRVLKTIYKFRSQRGAVHVSASYTPNHMDSKLIIECVRWAMAETLRVFWQGDRELVAKTIRELLQFDVPCVGQFGDVLLVQRTDLSAEEEVLVILHYAGELGFSRSELGRVVGASPSSVTRAIQKLEASANRQVVKLATGCYRLTDLGSKRIREQLADKLMLA